MDKPQYINNATFIGAPSNTTTSQLNPTSTGVDFTSTNASIIISFAPGITPIVVEVSIPNTYTNVNQTRVIITAPNGTVLFDGTSPPGTNKVNPLPLDILPENSTITITFQTNDGRASENVTLSVIACYTPSTATTMVTTGTVPPSITASSSTITISSTTSAVTSGTGKLR